MFDQLTHLVSEASGWAYAVLFVLALLDAIVPIVPSETSVITAGVVAAKGALSLPLVIVSAAAGAFAGDNLAYLLGRRYGSRVEARFFSGDKGRKRVDWAKGQLAKRGGELIIVGRFIPGGRTAVAVSAGTLRFAWPRFAVFDALAAIIWAVYAALLGYAGGHAFESKPWVGLLLAFVIAASVSGLVELVRWYRRRRRRAAGGGE